MARPTLSLIVPTRGRPEQLRRFLASIAATARRPECIEIVLVIDADDPASLTIDHRGLKLVRVVGQAGRTMGELNMAGYQASAGLYVMLLNDDVIVRTHDWDAIALEQFERFPDPFVLVHVNDTLMRQHLCTFPLISRSYCELAGGICPRSYHRYRIDDHIEDPFNLLAYLGIRRAVYLPEVVFEHSNAVNHPTAGLVYESDPSVLALDAPLFDAMLPERKELALRMLQAIDANCDIEAIRLKLDAVQDSLAIRTEGRQIVVRGPWWTRAETRYRRDGCVGLVRAVGRRIKSIAIRV